MSDSDWLSAINFNSDGLIPVIAQDHTSGRVLMMAWMNRESLEETVRSGTAVYWSRSRGKFWQKGEESGHIQAVHDIQLDCDGDVLILKVAQSGGIACHTGRESCFFRSLRDGEWVETEPVLKDPDEIYGDDTKQ
jgi:phosphoribosyl-AMP cyclohydrolase